MNKIKLTIRGGSAAIVAILSILAAGTAQASTLTAACSGSVSGDQITWTATSTGGNPPVTFLWSGDPSVAGQTSASLLETYTTNGTYNGEVQATDASSSVATSTCAATITANVPPVVATSTPPLPRVNPPTLSIGANGGFLSRGMTVTNIASGSFQAQVWGITYTINWSGNLYPQFYFRNGNGGNTTSSPVMQIAVGDEVGVSGSVNAANPLIVNANVVRDYNITMPRPGRREGQPSNPFYNGQGNASATISAGSSSSLQNFSQQIQSLLQQLNGLQNLFKNRGNGK